jgi:hypothetical protein
MEVTFTLTADDWAAWFMYLEEATPQAGRHRLSYRVDRSLKWVDLLCYAGAWLVPLVGLLIGVGQLSILLIVPLIGTVVMGYRLVFGKSYKDSRKQQLRPHVRGIFESELGEQRLKLTNQELIHATPLRTRAIPWSVVEKIDATVDHAFFIRSNLLAYVLPKRAFPQETDFSAFAEVARSYQEAAHRDGAAVLHPEAQTEPGFWRRPGGELEVVYKLRREDINALTHHNFAHGKQLRKGRRRRMLSSVWMFLSGVFMMNLAIVLHLTDPRMDLPSAVLAAGGGIVMLMAILTPLTSSLMMRFAMRHMSNQPHLLASYKRETEATRRMRLTADSLIYLTDEGVTATPWVAVEKIAMTTDHAFIHTAGAGILVLPRLAFRQESEFADFVEMANQRREAATGKSGDILKRKVGGSSRSSLSGSSG